MRRLSCTLPPEPTGSELDRERGAVIVLMTVFLVVIVAMAALVLDVGGLLDERRQLQNGADAASLAVAHSCALASCPGAGDALLAAMLANDNARDGQSGAVVTYPTPRRVRVDTSTRGDGNNILPYSFGQVLSGAKGQTVRANASAAWGPVGSLRAVPLAISSCDVLQLLSGPASVIQFSRPTGPCAGRDSSGAFGWLDGPCPATFTVGAQLSGNPGSSGPAGCLSSQLNKDVLIPVFDRATGTGTNTIYSIVGFAAFRLTGYRFPGQQSTPSPCSSPTTCIAGSFVKVVTTSGTGGAGGDTGPDYGVNRIFLAS